MVKQCATRAARWSLGLTALGAIVLLGACNRTPEAQVHDSMVEVLVPASTTVWDVANRALNDQSVADVSRLKEADWTALAAASQQMKDRPLLLAAQKHVVVADPVVKIEDEEDPGGSNAQDVQRYIDANPAVFAQRAQKLADTADVFLIAAKTRDGTKLEAASEHLDEVCDSCHEKFWFPEDAAPKH